MTFVDYWKRLVARNKHLGDENMKMTITVASFKREIEKAYFSGADDCDDADRSSSGTFDSLFGGIFGRGK